MTSTADALLTAHVEHELSRLQGRPLAELIDERVAALFRWLEDVKFNDIATPAQIAGVIERYVIELKISGGITELAGEMSNVVFTSELGSVTRVEDVCAPEAYEEFADKIAGLGGAQRNLFRSVIRSSAFGALASRVLAQAIVDLFFSTDLQMAGHRLRELFAALEQRLLPGFERRVAATLADYIERHLERLPDAAEKHVLDALDPQRVREIADEIWDNVSHKPLSEAVAFFTTRDLEDFVVLGYEFWLKFRKTEYFRAISREVVDRLFSKYGEESVYSVIEDMGVSEKMVADELKTFLAPVLEKATNTGFLEAQIRAHLEPFYRSDAVRAILER